MKKRVLSVVLAIFMVMSMMPICMVSVNAATTLTEEQFINKINSLKSDYPHGKYWANTNGTVSSGTYKGTSLAGNKSCGTGCGWHEGKCGTFALNGTAKAWQCHGFALLLGHKIFGSNANGWTNSKISGQVYAGDVIRIDINGNGADPNDHTIFVTKVDSTYLYYADCNYTGPCKINWDGKRKLSSRGDFIYIKHYSGNTLKGTGTTTPTLTLNYNTNGGTIPKCNEYKVDTSGSTLTLRSSASTSGSVLASMPDGTILTVTETKSAGGYTWGKTTYNGKTGWCALDYTEHQGFYADSSGKIFRNSNKKAVTQTGTYGKVMSSENGLYNASTFNLTRSGYKFIGWCAKKDGSSKIFDQNDVTVKAEDIYTNLKNGSPSGPIPLYAIWESTAEYSFSFDANGGTGSISPFKVKANQTFTLSGNAFTKDGYKQIGWNAYRVSDKKWHVKGIGWCTDAEITANNYQKDIYELNRTSTFDSSWTNGYSGVSNYIYYAVWELNTPTDTTITGISLSSIPNKESYTVGDTIDTSKIVLIATKYNGTYEQITSGFTVSPTTLSTEGTQKVTVSYGDRTTTFDIFVTKDKSTSTKATVNVKPSGTYYAVQYLPTSTCAGFSDGPAYNDKCIILCKDGNYYLGFFPYGASDATVTNGFLGYIPTNAFSSALNVPAASNYYLNIDAHATSSVKVYHRPGTTSIGTNGKYTSFESLSSGQAVKVLFELNGYYCVKTSNSVGFVNKNSIRLYADDKITGISVATDSLTVPVGSSVNSSDISVNATYMYNGVKAITDFTVTQPGTASVGQKYAEINYRGFKSFVPVTVVEPIVKNIQISSRPTQTMYFVGEEYDSTDLIVEAEYEDGRKKQIFEYELSYDFSEPGTKDITVTYNGFSDSYSVTVYSMPFISIENTDGYHGETVSVPIVYSAENLYAYALDMNINYNSNLLEYQGYENGNAFDDSRIVVNANPKNDSVIISAAGDEKLDDECWLISLYFTIKNPLSEITPEENTAIISFNDISIYGVGCEFNAFMNNGRVENLGEAPMPGDGNGDGKIDAEDLIVLRQALLTDSEYSEVLDANGDGVVDIRDLVRLKKYLVNNNTPLGKQENITLQEPLVTKIANISDNKQIA